MQCFRAEAMACCMAGSSAWPPASMKKTYSQFTFLLGRFSMSVRLMPASRKTSSTSARAPGLVGGGEEDGGLVVAGLLGGLAGNDPESRHVVGVVLDVVEQRMQAVKLAGQLASYGRDPLLFGCQFRRSRRARGGPDLRPLATDDRKFRHCAKTSGLEATVLIFSHGPLASRQWWIVTSTSAQIPRGRGQKRVQRVDHPAVYRVLHRHEAVVDRAAVSPARTPR